MKWLSAKDAALYIGRKSKTAYKTMLFLARAGKIRAGHDGKTFLFSSEDLDAWMYLNAKKASNRSQPSFRKSQKIGSPNGGAGGEFPQT